ncbi:MAG: hypothetical protein HZA79_11180 [Sphingobacteriales bacterium]|nr:hypothetical protein [Sphingobacteriales bacterium]
MKLILSERNVVVILFVLVLLTFTVAQEQSRAMETVYSGSKQEGQAVSVTGRTTIQIAGHFTGHLQ